MADDEKKLENEEAEKAAEKQDWQWDASAPLAGEDFLDISLPSYDEDEDEAEELPEESEEYQTEEAETAEEAEIPEEEIIEEEAAETDGDDSETPEGCCIICGEKIRNSKSEFYCNACRSKYMKVDYGASHIILAVVMVFVAVIGIVAFSATSKITGSVKEADRLASDGKISAAADAYDIATDTVTSLNAKFNAFLKGISSNFEDIAFFDGGSKIGKKKAEILSKTFSLSYNDSDEYFNLVESSFSEKELNSPKYADVKGSYDYIKKFFSDYSKANEELQSVYAPFFEAAYSGDAGENAIKEQKDKALEGIDKYAEENPDIDAGTIAYFKYTLLYFAQQSYGVKVEPDELYGYVSKAYNDAGDYGYIYFQDVASFALTSKKYEDVLSAANKIIEKNPSDSDAYYYKAFAYLRLEKFDEALKACDKVAEFSTDEFDNCAIKANILRRQGEFRAAADVCDSVPAESKTSEISRQEAIAYYLAGDEDNALKYAKEAYDSAYAESYNGGAFSLETVNTSALIYKLCGDDEDYDAIIDALEQSGAKLEDSVMEVINGDKTFEDLFMTGKGDI